MSKETLLPNSELEPLANILDQVFIQRRDLYAKQLDDGRYLCIRKPLKTRHLLAHLRGEITLGAYVLDRESCARFLALDADDDQQFVGLLGLHRSLSADGLPSYLEQSRRGGHLWLFLAGPVPGRDARAYGQHLLARHGLTGIELFPKQDELNTGPGSLIRLPFGVHRRNGVRYGFVHANGRPLAPTLREQIRLLSNPQTVPLSALDMGRLPEVPEPAAPVEAPAGNESAPLSQRIKDSVSVAEFVGRYLELSPNGRGFCPFHDDRRRSFSVNAEENYWHCFAGCGGGSVIDFWMKWQDCDFKTAITELAQLMLSST